mgnify:CR=1 FL=1
MKNINKKIYLPKNIIHINETHNIKELIEYYSMGDVFLNLSLEETFGKVSAEALACGVPVITNDSTAKTELIGEGCGYIVKSQDVNEILNYIKLIQKNTKSFYSKNCIDYARKKFDKTDRIKDHLELYNKII